MLLQLFWAFNAPGTLWKEPGPEKDVISVPVQHQTHPNEPWRISKPCLMPHKLVLLYPTVLSLSPSASLEKAATKDR